MGHLLQEFYEQCNFLPSGLGVAGEAFARRQNQWASGEEMLLQISFLSSQNRQLVAPPSELLESHYFKTVVCIPLEKGAGVLELGTTELVPKNDASMIYRILRFINGPATHEGTPRAEQIMCSPFEACTKALPNDGRCQSGDPDEQYGSAAMMKTQVGRGIFRHPSTTSSHNWSFSSTTSSSTPSTSDQMGSSNTTFVLNTSPAQVTSMNNEDTLLTSPVSPLQATPKSMVDSFDLQGLRMPIIRSGEEMLDYEYLDVVTHHNHLPDCVFQPMPCGFNARNDTQVDTGSYAYGSAEAEAYYKKVVEGSSTSQGAGGQVGEAEKVVASSTLGGLNSGSGRQQDDQYIVASESNVNFTSRLTPAKLQHNEIERKRRREEGDCINILRNLVPNVPKKDKTTVLESTIRHIKELQGRVHELEQEKNSKRSQENCICDYVEDEDTIPHFRLSLTKNIQDIEANIIIINIMDALQKRNLYCFSINSQFWKNTSELSIQILANYKDGGTYSPNLDEIQHIKQWWKHLIKD